MIDNFRDKINKIILKGHVMAKGNDSGKEIFRYSIEDFRNKYEMEAMLKIALETAENFKEYLFKAGVSRFRIGKIINKKNKYRLSYLWEFPDEETHKKVSPMIEKMIRHVEPSQEELARIVIREESVIVLDEKSNKH